MTCGAHEEDQDGCDGESVWLLNRHTISLNQKDVLSFSISHGFYPSSQDVDSKVSSPQKIRVTTASGTLRQSFRGTDRGMLTGHSLKQWPSSDEKKGQLG